MKAKTLKEKFGKRVRAVRHDRDLTQQQLAESISVSPEYVSKIERGQSSPSFQIIARLTRALRVSPRDLFDFSGTIAS